MDKLPGSSSTATLPSAGSQARGPSPSSEDLVTPAIQEEFDRIFGAGSDTDTAVAEPEPNRPGSGPSGEDRRLEAEQAEENELDAQRKAAQPGSPGTDEDEPGGQPGAEKEKPDDGAGAQARPKEGEDKPDGGLTLSPALRHAARRNDWSDEEIDAFYEQNPAVAERTFDRLRTSYNDLNMQFARLGQQPTQGQGQPAPAAPPAGPSPPTPPSGASDDPLAAVFQDKVAQLRQSFGDDFMDQIIQCPRR